ncbi:MAG TPA: TIGR02757 family protein [Sedimentisphaerales bacterium]|nr:TIGR02757 family protein [Sedimentisphaerales bacterium]
MSKRTAQIEDCLETLYARYNRREFIGSDPLQFVYEYSSPADMEVAAFLSAGLAYGRVQQIQKSLTNLFGRMGESLYAFVRNFDERKRAKLKDFKHRFTTGDDISDLLALLRDIIDKFNSIEKFFTQGYNPSDRNIVPALSKFCNSLLEIYAAEHNGKTSRGLKYLLVNPANGSACKRLNLFLRWMVRDDDVDAGLWKSIDKAKLIVPVDVHMTRLCRIIGFHGQKTASLSTALKITESFTEIEPTDPAKYDFALTRIGILDNCTGKHRSDCEFCDLFAICFHG